MVGKRLRGLLVSAEVGWSLLGFPFVSWGVLRCAGDCWVLLRTVGVC